MKNEPLTLTEGNPSKLRHQSAILPDEWEAQSRRPSNRLRLSASPDGSLTGDWYSFPTTRLADADGGLLSGDWQFVCSGWNEADTYHWKSNPVVDPDVKSLEAKVNTFLQETGDSHNFVEAYTVLPDKKVVYIHLGG